MAVELPTLRWGPSGSARVLAVHGLSSSAHIWWRVASDIADRGWQVVAPDLRGHGHAPRTTTYRLEEFVADLLELGHGWDVVLGHSLGGTVAALAGLEPGFCRRLVLLDPVLCIPDDGFEDLIEAQLAELEPVDALEMQAANPAWHPDDVFWKRWSASLVTPSTVERVFADNRPWDITARVAGLSIPVLLLAADPRHGGLLDPGLADELSTANPALSWSPVSGVGHSIQRERPDLVVRTIVTGA